jgi:hypothetical protein
LYSILKVLNKQNESEPHGVFVISKATPKGHELSSWRDVNTAMNMAVDSD